MKVWLGGLLLFSAPAAAESIGICYNYGCATEARVEFSELRLATLRALLNAALDPARERAALAAALGLLYTWAGEQSPIWRDRGEDYPDGDVDGRMDCIDHATSTTRLLRVLEQQGWLRFHRVLDPARRTRLLFTQHFSAVIEEVVAPTGISEVPEPAARFAVDTWFLDHGEPATVMPLELWLAGAYPRSATRDGSEAAPAEPLQ